MILHVDKEFIMTADHLIPAILVVLLRSKVINLYSNLYYIKNFAFENDVESGELGAFGNHVF